MAYGNWEFVKDSSGAIQFVTVGTNVPFGVQAVPLGNSYQKVLDTLPAALKKIGATALQAVTFQQAADIGAIQQGKTTTVDTKGKESPEVPSGSSAVPSGVNISNPLSALSSAAQAIGDVVQALGDVWGAITNPHNWLRALEVVGGAILIYFALKQLAGVNGSPVIETVKKGAAGAAAIG